jgi:GNAT superfamily N-acetyltransferase
MDRRIDLDRADELLGLAFAGEHHAAVSLARARPELAERLRRTSASALIEAARAGRDGTVYTLLELGVPANTRDERTGGTALHVAAALGHVDVVDVLVGWVALDLHARDARGATALDACVDGAANLVIAKILVANGLRPDADVVARASGALAAWLREAPARTSLDDEFAETAWAAAVAMLEHLSRSPLAQVRRVGDGFAVRTGLFDNTRNGVACSRLSRERIVDVLEWLGAPAQWFVAAETEPPDLRERLERGGCHAERTAVYMAARLSELDLADGGAVEITRIRDAGEMTDAFTRAGQLSDDPVERDRELALLASLGLEETAPLRHYAARHDGHTVGIVSAFAMSSTLALTSLGVASAARRRGAGRALVAHALREGRAAGCAVAVLDPTPATVPFYEALGFTLGRFPTDRAFYTPSRMRTYVRR